MAEVLKGRGITLAEAQKLNPGLDLAKAKDGQMLVLPYGRYTQREKEMLSSVVPASSLGLAGVAVPNAAQLQVGLLVALAAAGYAFYVKARHACLRSAALWRVRACLLACCADARTHHHNRKRATGPRSSCKHAHATAAHARL